MSVCSVNTNLGAYAALASLTQTQAALATTQQQLATGKKVGGAADNSAVYSISQAMNADIAGQVAVSDSLAFGGACVGITSSAVASISSTLAALKNTVTQGQQTGIDPAPINDQINALLSNIDAYAQSATYNGVNLIAGTTGNGITTNTLKVPIDTIGNQFNLPNGTDNSSVSFALGPNNGSIALYAGTCDAGSGFNCYAPGPTQLFIQAGHPGSPSPSAPNTQWVFTLDDGTTPASNFINAKSVFGTTTVTDLGNGDILCSSYNSSMGSYENNIRVDVSAFAGGAGSPGLAAGPQNTANIAGALSKLVADVNKVGFNASLDANNNLTISSGDTVQTAMLGSYLPPALLGLATSTSTWAGISAGHFSIRWLRGPRTGAATILDRNLGSAWPYRACGRLPERNRDRGCGDSQTRHDQFHARLRF